MTTIQSGTGNQYLRKGRIGALEGRLCQAPHLKAFCRNAVQLLHWPICNLQSPIQNEISPDVRANLYGTNVGRAPA